jgi:hypothetical protein
MNRTSAPPRATQPRLVIRHTGSGSASPFNPDAVEVLLINANPADRYPGDRFDDVVLCRLDCGSPGWWPFQSGWQSALDQLAGHVTIYLDAVAPDRRVLRESELACLHRMSTFAINEFIWRYLGDHHPDALRDLMAGHDELLTPEGHDGTWSPVSTRMLTRATVDVRQAGHAVTA